MRLLRTRRKEGINEISKENAFKNQPQANILKYLASGHIFSNYNLTKMTQGEIEC